MNSGNPPVIPSAPGSKFKYQWDPDSGWAQRATFVGKVAGGMAAEGIKNWAKNIGTGTGGGQQPAASGQSSSGRNKPLPKRSGGLQPGSDEELNQFRQWQGSQSQWSGLGTGRVWRGYESLSGIGMDHDRSQYKFHDVHPRTGWGSGRAVRTENVNEGQGEDTRPSTVEGGNVDMAPESDSNPFPKGSYNAFDDVPLHDEPLHPDANKPGYDKYGLPEDF